MGNASSTPASATSDAITRHLPEPQLICEHAGPARPLLESLFDRVRVAKERVEGAKCDEANRASFVELLFKVNELGLVYGEYTFGKRVIEHKIFYDQVRELQKSLDELLTVLGVKEQPKWSNDVESGYTKLVDALRATVASDDALRRIYAKNPALRAADVNELEPAQQSFDGQQSSDIAKLLLKKLIHWKARVEDNEESEVALPVKDSNLVGPSLLVHRSQIAVLGSNGAGKSSLAKSLATIAATSGVAASDEAATAVECHQFAFQSTLDVHRRYEVNLWDLGEGAPHGLYFTKKTLFLVCVDLQAYATVLMRGEDKVTQDFVLDKMCRWIELIVTRHPGAKITLVGTKADLPDANNIETIQNDLNRRLKLWTQSFVDLVPVSIGWAVKPSLKTMCDRGLLLLNANQDASVINTRAAIEELIDTTPSLQQPMTVLHSRVLEAVQLRRVEAAKCEMKDRLDRVLVPTSLVKILSKQLNDLPVDECKSILLELHDIREILWFNGDTDSADQMILLDPSIVQPEALQDVVFPTEEDFLVDEETLGTITKLLCLHGATWNSVCEQRLAELRAEIEEDFDFVPDAKLIQAGLAACSQLWLNSRKTDPLKSLVDVPFEIYKGGEASVKEYVEQITNATDQELVFRCKVCIVGRGLGGKTSLIKSMSAKSPQLVSERDRTIGIDLFPIKFTHSTEANGAITTKNYEVTCWDFAGQDVYQVAHTLFFSQRTLYLLCVDLKEYADQLDDNSDGQWNKDGRLQRFLQERVFRWTRLIYARQPDAEIVVVGTKADAIAPGRDKLIIADFDERLKDWIDKYIVELDDEQKLRVQDSLLFLRSGERYTVTVATQEGVDRALETIQELILSKPARSIPMPPVYTRVLENIRQARKDAANSNDQRAMVKKVVVLARTLIPQLVSEIVELSSDSCQTILTTFHNLGDILWYQQESKGQLKDIIILKPTLALDVVREVINHNYPLSNDPRLRDIDQSGEISHELLMEFPLWKALREVRADLVLFFKNLLWLFHLAYPVGTNEMVVTSNLIVPTYWQSKRQKEKQPNRSQLLQRQQTVLSARSISNACSATWQYVVPVEIAKTIFDQFIVASHSKFFKRIVTEQSVDVSLPGDFAARIIHQVATTTLDDIRIEVVGASDEICWDRMRFFVMAMERVVDGYPGLSFHRELVHQEGEKEKAEQVDAAVRELSEAQEMGFSVASVRRRLPWLPPSLRWYTEKAWRTPGLLDKIDAEERIKKIEHMTSVLRKLIETSDTKQRFPAVWTIEYDHDGSALVLRLFSDVSGVCYHAPIRVRVPSATLAKYGDFIQVGLSVFSLFPVADLVKDIVDKAVELTSRSVDDSISNAKAVHEFAAQMDFTGGAVSGTGLPRETSTQLLQDLLLLHDASFTMLKVPELSGLVCAAQPDGRFVWASEDEFNIMKNQIPGLQIRGVCVPVEAVATQSNVTIAIKSVNGLQKSDWNRVRCEWQLVSTTNKAMMHGETSLHRDKNSIPAWNEFAEARMPSLDDLRDFDLMIQVKQKSTFMKRMFNDEFVTLFGGSLPLKSRLSESQNGAPVHFEAEIAMDGQPLSTYVSCIIDIAPIKAPAAY